MTGTHREGADHDGVALSDPTIGDHAAEKRCEVNETGVEPENLRRQRASKLLRPWSPCRVGLPFARHPNRKKKEVGSRMERRKEVGVVSKDHEEVPVTCDKPES